MKFLGYDFYKTWGEKDVEYKKPFSKRILDSDRQATRAYIAALVASFPLDKTITWLDIGAGEGVTLKQILQHVPNLSERNIKFVIVEPDVNATEGLRKQFSEYKNISCEIIQEDFDISQLSPDTYDIITFLHSAYYIGDTRESFEQIFTAAYSALYKGGILLVQGIKSTGDFQLLGEPKYSPWACGDKVCSILTDVWSTTECKEFPVRFSVHDYLKSNLNPDEEWELEQFYLFAKHDTTLAFTPEEREVFLQRMRSLSVAHGDSSYLDFKDWVSYVRKG